MINNERTRGTKKCVMYSCLPEGGGVMVYLWGSQTLT